MNLEKIYTIQQQQELESLERSITCLNIYKELDSNQAIINTLSREVTEHLLTYYELLTYREESLNYEIRKELLVKIFQHLQKSTSIIIEYNQDTHSLKGLYNEKGERIGEIIITNIHRDDFMHPIYNQNSQPSLSQNLPITHFLTETELARTNKIYSLGTHIPNNQDQDCFQALNNANQYLVRTFDKQGCSSIMEVYPTKQEYILNRPQYIKIGSYQHHLNKNSETYTIEDCKKEDFYLTEKPYRGKIWPKKIEEAVYYEVNCHKMARILQRKK